ncbi:hypothetical protein ACO0LB_09160 [Undibacterium sp. SXout7W]|uniref:hypothetical protein n=1 Tax=Undibacterium sp. SXout7W TaxID=3413049 RepID=UPI003BF133ED
MQQLQGAAVRNDDLAVMPKIKIPEGMYRRMAECKQKPLIVDQKPRNLFVPGLRPFLRVMSNHLARSSLFAPINSGGGKNTTGSGGENRKKYHTGSLLVSRRDAEIKYWGEQLTEAHADVWMQVIYEAIKHPLGEIFEIKGAQFLSAIGRANGGNDYDWLKKTLLSLHHASLVIEVWQGSKSPSEPRQLKLKIGKSEFGEGDLEAIRLIEKFRYVGATKSFQLSIDTRWHLMYENKEFALIDSQKRMQLKTNIAKALQRLIATSNSVEQRYALESEENGVKGIKEIFQYTGRLRDFSNALKLAISDLKNAKIISDGYLEISTKNKLQIVLKKLISRGQQ